MAPPTAAADRRRRAAADRRRRPPLTTCARAVRRAPLAPQLLAERGIDSSVPDAASEMALELFDNTEYESRPIDEWLALGEAREDGTLHLPALCLRPPTEGGKPAAWVEGNVQSYDEASQLFTVLCASADGAPPATVAVPRIRLCFRAEDPFTFADRVTAAYAYRESSLAEVRYALTIECMPTEELRTLEKERLARMLQLALSTERLREAQSNPAVISGLLAEVHHEYGRAMASIIFRKNAEAYHAAVELTPIGQPPRTAPSDAIFDGVTVPPPPNQLAAPPPHSGLIDIGAEHDFGEQQRSFGFLSLLTKREIIFSLHKIRAQCNEVLSLSLLSTRALTKSFTDEEFIKEEETVTLETVKYLKEGWMSSLKAHVRNGLKGVGKGWYNLAETNREVYGMSKLSRFLKMVTYMMQDCVIYMAEASLTQYAEFMIERASFDVDVHTPSHTLSTPVSNAYAHLPPLFACRLVADPALGVVFGTPPERCVEAAIAAFDRAAAGVADLPQLEKFIMEGLFWSDTPFLQTISAHEGLAVQLRERLSAALHATLPPMAAYLALYEQVRAAAEGGGVTWCAVS